MKELMNTFLRHFVIASSWGIVLLIVFFIAMFGIKQQVKEAIQYSARTAIGELTLVALDPYITSGVKRNIKKGIEFTADTLKRETKELLMEIESKDKKRD